MQKPKTSPEIKEALMLSPILQKKQDRMNRLSPANEKGKDILAITKDSVHRRMLLAQEFMAA